MDCQDGQVVRPWKDIDWEHPRPSHQEMVDSWTTVRWESVPVSDPAVDRYLEQVQATHVNGGYLFGRWRATRYSDVTAWFAARNRHDEYETLRLLFDADVVRSDLAELKIPRELKRIPGKLKEQWAGALCLDGILAGVIVSGGAYRQFDGTATQAKVLAGRAVDALVQERYEDFRLDTTHRAWTPWFHDIAWDSTYVLTDRANAEITVLCITDTD
jgi:hypothetical protein